jgi:PAS domain S-box-containing protein
MSTQVQASFLAHSAPIRPGIAARHSHVTALFRQYECDIYTRTNRLFLGLLLAQWTLAIMLAGDWTPLSWFGSSATIHPHVPVAVLLGGLLAAPAIALILWMPNEIITRHAVAVSQMGFSSLLIHMSGGRLEFHFHVFGSLAFLALYREWRVLPTAIIIVMADHVISGLWFPASIYGASFATISRSYEHGGWVLFESAILGWSCVVSRREMWLICEREDENQRLLAEVEGRLEQRNAVFSKMQERTSAMIRSLPIGIFETARTGEVLFANETMLKMLGLEEARIAELDVNRDAALTPGDRELLWSLLDRQGYAEGFESILHLPNGTHIHVAINARLKHNGEGIPATCEGSLADISKRKRTEQELELLNAKLVDASRQVGMAEAATGVLHNVGNVLTSVNLTVHDMQDRLSASRITHLRRVADLFEAHQADLGEFLQKDPTGIQIPAFLVNLTRHLETENRSLRDDMMGLSGHFEHIREIIVAQQSSARILGIVEEVSCASLVEDALRLAAESFERHHIGLARRVEISAMVRTDRHKVLQVLINLLKNAKDALLHLEKPNRLITVRAYFANPTQVAIAIIDNGTGIAPENLTKIFGHGFTTKKNGHGFGLHSAAIAAKEIKGDLTVDSDGLGHGSTFTLLLPVTPAPAP